MTDPIDETQPHAMPPPRPASPVDDASEPGSATPTRPAEGLSEPVGTTGSAPSGATSLRVDPETKPTEWREPPWFPPRDKNHGPSLAAVIVGLVLIAIGLYFFIDRTLGINLPDIRWSTIWPIVLILVGGLILFRSVSRRT
jgi:Domain of unknown function (DUF5668)